ncbi:pyruvate dehydrogenase e2 component (dihydrolipoamide acetyltransferase) [Colletotrichum asianum]
MSSIGSLHDILQVHCFASSSNFVVTSFNILLPSLATPIIPTSQDKPGRLLLENDLDPFQKHLGALLVALGNRQAEQVASRRDALGRSGSSSSRNLLRSGSSLLRRGEDVVNVAAAASGRSDGAGRGEGRLGQRGDLGQVVSPRAAGRELVQAEDLVEELVGGGLAGGGRQVVVGDLGGARDEGGHGHEDAERLLDTLLRLEDLVQGDGEGDLGLHGGRGGGGGRRGGRLLGLLLLLGRDLDVAEVEVRQLGGVAHELARGLGVDGAQVGEDVALEQAAGGARGLDPADGVLVEAVLVDEVLDGGVEGVPLLAGLAGVLLLGLGGLAAFGGGALGGGFGLGGLRGGGGLVLFGGDLEGGEVVAGLGDDGNAGANLDGLGAVAGGDLEHDAVVLGLDVHGGLVGLDLEEDVAGGEGLALLDLPAGDVTLRHGRGQGGHGEVLRGEASC